MTRFLLLATLAFCCAPGLAPVQAAPLATDDAITTQGQWIPLFNGRDLDGWTPKIRGYGAGENFGDTFRVVDGLLTVAYDQYGGPFDNRFGHLFYKQPFSNYILRLEYRFVGEQCPGGPAWAMRNSGVMIHGQTPESMGQDQNFPVSIEVQLLGGDGQKERPTGNLCTPGTHVVLKGELYKTHCINSSSPTFTDGQWVTAEIEVHGNGIVRHIINGMQVLDYEQPQLDPTDGDAKKLIPASGDLMLHGGTISLQSESGPIQFRRVEIKLLPSEN